MLIFEIAVLKVVLPPPMVLTNPEALNIVANEPTTVETARELDALNASRAEIAPIKVDE